ncbi:excisionase family DNA-binding protein [Rubrivivax gelatinosus]|uniref:Helix-turn-helix domain-containing protein n=1 Tax=Rubrivivax gelatinosus (strain NBRC 100245 / IL144) TaxID=983917 RepID=I0HM20_RUBGI|nr:excisionase family DNA-binding protein [Rubrivivax gelatinosus]BAL94057.1 hypothetical protein RGE_07140 [Rubrivivax gelatinosus IL144]
MSNATLDKERLLHRPLTPAEAELARAAQRCLMATLDHSRAAAITVESDDGVTPAISVPPAALRLIADLLGALSEGKPVALMPARQELTTVEAANLLNVSRPFLIKEIEAGRLPHRMVGTHRRIAFEDLQRYREKTMAQRHQALQAMADDLREQGLNY